MDEGSRELAFGVGGQVFCADCWDRPASAVRAEHGAERPVCAACAAWADIHDLIGHAEVGFRRDVVRVLEHLVETADPASARHLLELMGRVVDGAH